MTTLLMTLKLLFALTAQPLQCAESGWVDYDNDKTSINCQNDLNNFESSTIE